MTKKLNKSDTPQIGVMAQTLFYKVTLVVGIPDDYCADHRHLVDPLEVLFNAEVFNEDFMLLGSDYTQLSLHE